MATNYRKPTIPTNVIVHLGEPDQVAKNITVPFQEYIKNVASSEVYATWPTDAIKANVLAQISFALNRIYNEWYPSKGYEFDITSSPKYDQTFIEDRAFYDSVAKIVDEIFNDYIVRTGQIQPLFAQYCDGKTTTCNGLSQWGTVTLAKQGKNPNEILEYYYGNDIDLIYNAQLADNIETYPGFPIKLGISGDMVVTIKRELNRIRQNYPAIPEVDNTPFFTVETEKSVKAFQKIFNLEETGIVDKETWYKLKYIYNSVKKIANLFSEGITEEEAEMLYSNELKYLDTGSFIRVLHYLLRSIAYFDNDIPFLNVESSTYGENTVKMVKAFQEKYGIPQTGSVDKVTWVELKNVYNEIINNLPDEYLQYADELYPGRFLSLGMDGEDVKRLQMYLYKICKNKGNIPGVRVTGEYDELTQKSIVKLQTDLGLPVTGVVGPVLWYEIVNSSKN